MKLAVQKKYLGGQFLCRNFDPPQCSPDLLNFNFGPKKPANNFAPK